MLVIFRGNIILHTAAKSKREKPSRYIFVNYDHIYVNVIMSTKETGLLASKKATDVVKDVGI